MEIFNIISAKIDVFMLIFARMTGLLLIAPIFGSRMLPIQIKIGFSVLFSLILLNVIPGPQSVHIDNIFELTFLLLNEVIVGLAIGFTAQIIFSAIQFAGLMIDTQLGFSIVNVIDPQFGTQVPLMGNFKYVLALLLFLITNSHHLLLTALVKSYDFIPLTGFKFNGSILELITNMIEGMMITAIKIALPVVGVLFVVDLALGLLAKTVPQMNVFVVGMPAKIIVGLITIAITLPIYVFILTTLFDGSFSDIFNLIKAMH